MTLTMLQKLGCVAYVREKGKGNPLDLPPLPEAHTHPGPDSRSSVSRSSEGIEAAWRRVASLHLGQAAV